MKHTYHSLKGDFFVRKRGGSAQARYIGNTAEASFSMTRETIELKSSGNETGTLASEEVSKEATLSLTLNSMATQNLAMVLYADVQEQAAATAQTFTLPALSEGEAFELAHANVSNVSITGLTAGVDYKVLAKGGVIVALRDLSATANGTYDASTAEQVGVFSSEAAEYEVIYVSEASGKKAKFLRWKPNPAQTLNLISSEFASFQIEGPCLIDDTIPEGPLGRFAVLTSV